MKKVLILLILLLVCLSTVAEAKPADIGSKNVKGNNMEYELVSNTAHCIASECSLIFRVRYSKQFNSNKITKAFTKDSRHNMKKSGYRIRRTVTTQEKVWATLERDCKPPDPCGNWETVEKTRYVWETIKPGEKLAPGVWHYIELWGMKEATLGKNDFDAIPVMDGFPLPYAWWNSSWSYRQPITITNANATDSLPAGYSVNISLDTATLTSQGKMLASGNDVRIVFSNSSGNYSLIWENTTAFNTADTQIWFKTQEAIAGGGSDSTGYDIFYGNSLANAPPQNDTSAFLLYADADDTTNATTPDGWESNTIATDEQAYSGTKSIRVVDESTYKIRDIENVSSGQVLIDFWTKPVTAPLSADDWFMPSHSDNVWQNYLGIDFDNDGKLYAVDYTPDYTILNSSYTSSWYHVALLYNLDSDWGSSFVDGIRINNWSKQLTPGAALSCIWAQRSRVFYDDIVVRRYLTPEPTTLLGSEETESGIIINFVAPTPANLSHISTGYIEANVTIDENVSSCLLEWLDGTPSNETMTIYNADSSTVCTKNMTLLSDGVYVFTVYADGIVGGLDASTQRNITLDTVAPNVDFVTPTPANGSSQFTNNSYINVSIIEPWISGAELEFSGSNYSMSCVGNFSCWYNITDIAEGTHDFLVYVDDQAGNLNATETRTITIDRSVPAVTVMAPINDSYHVSNTTNLLYSVSDLTGVSDCWYEMNGTNTTLAGCVNTTLITPDFIKYNFTLYANDTDGNLNSTYIEFWGKTPAIQNCSYLSTVKTIAFNMKEEANRTAINATMEITLWLRSGDFTDDYSFNLENNETHHVCIYPNSSEYEVDATIEYYATDYTRRNYFLSNASISNNTMSVDLILLNFSDSDDIEFLLKDVFHNLQGEVTIKAQKFYTQSNEYIAVAMGRTGPDGIAGIPLERNRWYKFVLERNYTVLKVFDPMYLTEYSLELYVPRQENVEYFEYVNKVAYSCTYNNDTKNLVCTVSDTSGKMVETRLVVDEKRVLGNWVTVCENTSTSSSTTLVCNLADQENKTVQYTLMGRFCCSQETYFTMDTGIISLVAPILTLGAIGVLIAFMLLITSGLMGVWNPAIGVSLMMVTLFISLSLGLITGTEQVYGAFMALLVSAALIVYKVKT